MAKDKYSYNPITSPDVNWNEVDPSNGKKWSGKSIREFVQNRIKEMETKPGSFYFDPITLTQYMFANAKDREAWLATGQSSLVLDTCPFPLSGTQNQVKVINEMPSGNLYFTTQSKVAMLTCSFISQEKGLTDNAWTEVTEDFLVTVFTDKGSVGNFEELYPEKLVLNGQSFSFDVRNAIAVGANRVRVNVKGVESGASSQYTYTVNLTTMYLADAKFQWNVPFIQGEAFALGGMYIGGELDKKLRIRMTNERGYLMEYEVNLGITTSEVLPYYFGGLEFPVSETLGGTGIYNVELWLDANGLESEHLSYNIICVEQADRATAQLVAISNAAQVAVNDTSNKLFDYVVYNGGKNNADPTVNVDAIINGTTKSLVSDKVLSGVVTGTINSYTLEFLIETEESDVQIHSTIELGSSKQEAIHLLDNSKSYPAEKGAWFYMNPNNRSNSDVSKESILNESSLPSAEREYAATWTNVSFVDGMDGWTVDNDGRNCLRLPAGSKVEIDYTPFLNQSTLTIEACYKAENASDFNEDVIRIASSAVSDFVGVRVKPTNVVLHSQGKKTEDILQGYNLKDEETVHLLVTIVKDYKFIGNLAQIYVNGVPKCSFEWDATDTFSHGGKIVLGSDTADLNIYKLRVYRDVIQAGTTIGVSGAFDWVKSVRNFISCLPDKASKDAAYERMHTVINDGNKLDYEKVRNSGMNYFVARLPKGRQIPSKASPSSVPGCTLTVNIQQNKNFPANGVFEDVETEPQGTTAMNYWLWNLRWKTLLIRITAKKNFASSMHSHKMGATALFNDLHEIVVGPNEANGRVAVEQYGAYGFAEVMNESGQYVMIPLGLYTIGQDKGDKPTFGYNDPEYKDTLIHMEGSDHSPKGVGMEYPWAKLGVYTDKEGDQYLGELKADGTVEKAWEVGACGAAKTDKDALAYLTQEFKPAYDVDYHNTSLIVGLPSGTTIAQVNADLNAFRATPTDNGFTYADCLIWIDGEYDTYFFNNISGKYEKDGFQVLTAEEQSLVAGKTLEEKNAFIRELRRERYRAEMENYWHLRDSLFHYCFIVLFAATDNFKKNTYPYKFGTLASGSRWRWRQDDLDTLFDINNQGLANKIYSLLNGDKSGTTHIFQGNNSYHWTNIQFYYESEIKQMMLDIMTAMAEMGEGDSLIEKAIDCIRKYFWAKAQEYFPETAYNNDAEITYEEAWAALKAGKYDAPVDPLQQSLGSHYEAEKAFVELRFIFMASLYGFGAFGVGNDADTTLGQMTFRPARGDHHFSLTPSINMNPTILIGDSNSKSEERRLMAGETAEIDLATDGDTSIYLQGLDYLTDIGNLSKQQFYDQNPVITALISKRLQTLKLGDADASQVTTNLKGISNINCPSLSEMDARNVSTLQGSIDLSKCPRIRKALFGGTAATGITLPKGSKITEFELPDTIQNLTLQNLPNLNEGGLKYGDLTALTYLRIEGNKHIDGFGLLKATFADGAPLSNIRIIGFDYSGNADDAAMIATLAKGGYYGIDENGSPNYNTIPVLEGTLNIDGSIYEEDKEYIDEQYKGRITLNVTGGFYMRFADDEVKRILLANGVGDGVGITTEQTAAVTDIKSWFADNTVIETFDEFEKFTGVAFLGASNISYRWAFSNCSSLRNIVLPQGLYKIYNGTTGYGGVGGFFRCSSLEYVGNIHVLKEIGSYAFYGCTSLEIEDLQLSNLETLGQNAFYGVKIKKISNLGNLTELPAATSATQNFGDKSTLEEVVLPETLTTLSGYTFNGYTSLKSVNVNYIKSWSCTEGQRTFYGVPMEEYSFSSLESLTGGYASHFMDSGVKRITSLGVVTSIPSGNGDFYFAKNCSNLEYVNLPTTLTSIGGYAFWGCSKLNVNEIPASLTTISYSAFQGCKLDGVVINCPNLTTIGNNAFFGTGITRIESLGSVTTLGATSGNIESNGVFGQCKSLSFVELPNTIATIGAGCFYKCTSLRTVICKATTPPTLVYNSFDNSHSDLAIYVPDASVTAYQEATNWSSYADRIKPLSEYTE